MPATFTLFGPATEWNRFDSRRSPTVPSVALVLGLPPLPAWLARKQLVRILPGWPEPRLESVLPRD